MSSRLAVKHPVTPADNFAQTPVAQASPAALVQAAANDETSEFSAVSDPLIGMAAATVIMLAVLAALMAVG